MFISEWHYESWTTVLQWKFDVSSHGQLVHLVWNLGTSGIDKIVDCLRTSNLWVKLFAYSQIQCSN